MADPISITAAVGWGVKAVGWLASPIISRLLNKGFALLNLDAPAKLKMLDVQVLQLQRVMEIVDESTYRVRLEPLLEKLKSAFYEAEDILDRVEYERLNRQIQDAKSGGSKIDSLGKKLRSVMPRSPLKDEETGMSKSELEKSLKKIESAISDACEVLEKLNLPAVSSDKCRPAVATSSPSAGITGHVQVIGRDQDRDNIIAMLHEMGDQYQANTVSGTGYSVIGIHGIGGSGKSTLARCVYDHEKMESHFDIVMWIHVSQKFSLDSIFSQMFEGATQGKCPKFSSLNVLKEILEEKLRGKRILLVLDDVWYNIKNSEDREELQKLISPMHVGKAGSKILVTSRTEAALVTLGAVKERCIPISDLDDEVFLEMFMHYALRDASVGDHDRRRLETIGEDIAKKLKRSPLAARTVGSRLRETQTFEFWMSEKDRDLLNDTMGALWWSYQFFDEHVRRCFTYCSIFPRGHRLKRDELVKLWVAEGFIKTSKPEEESEDVAKNYFDELLSASFLQLAGKEGRKMAHGPKVEYFTIHDLLCDLAGEVAGKDCYRLEKGCTEEIPQDVRYLFVGDDREMLIKKIPALKNLRTLILDYRMHVNLNSLKDFVSMFITLTGLPKLRVLQLCVIPGHSNKFSLPDSIGQWKHMRYFAFLVTGHMELSLPDSFTKLYHMQVVDFGSCMHLAFAGDMMNLINLRLIISKLVLEFPNVGRLSCLQRLPFFSTRKEQGYEPHQLKHLNKLQDKLHIDGLENVQSKEEALEINLAGKEKLTELVLQWDDTFSPEVQAEVLEGLCPSKYIESMSSSWDALPGMEHLTSLKKLKIRHCEDLLSLGTLPKSLEKFTVLGLNRNFMRSCITTADPNWQKIEHVPKKNFVTHNGQSWVPFC